LRAVRCVQGLFLALHCVCVSVCLRRLSHACAFAGAVPGGCHGLQLGQN
jgi:hypothetical protein